MVLSPRVTRRIYVTIVEYVYNAIRDGLLKPGDKLPPERELAAQFNASRASVREALAALEVLGLIDCKPGIGNVIRETAQSINVPSVSEIVSSSSPYEVYETRLAFEPTAACLAAKRVRPEDLEPLRKLVVQMQEALESGDYNAFHRLDREFHASIVSLTGNTLIIHVLGEALDHMKKSMWMILKNRMVHDKAQYEGYQASHKAIVACLEKQDCSGIKEVMTHHIMQVGKDLFGDEDPQ